MSFDLGTTIGSYEIVERLGKGGMATVYKAYHERLDRYVAIKVLHSAFKDDDSFLRRFTREAQVVARLEHTNIVPVYDFAEHDGYPYLVMRYIEGETLKERMSQGALSLPEILRIASAVSKALDYAHAQGVLHRDIKPSNVLLTQGGGVYIADFGLARITQAGESTLSQEMIMGTPQYISPEQAKGNKELDGRTDIYSFGIILYEMITGQVPFQSDTGYATIHSQIFDEPPKPSTLNENINPVMEAVLLKALAKEPEERFSSAGELLVAFDQAAQDMPANFAPAGMTVLPDYTPAGQTRLSVEPISTPVEEFPSLPDLVDETEESLVEEKEVAPHPSKKRSPFLMGFGIVAGVFICVALLFVITRQRALNRTQMTQTAQAKESATKIMATEEISDVVSTPLILTTTPQEGTLVGEPLSLDFAVIPDRIRPVGVLEPLLEADPENNQLQLELVLAYLQDGQRDEARSLVGKLIGPDRRAVIYIAIAERLMEGDQLELASLVLEEGLQTYISDIRIQHLLLMTYILNEVPEQQIKTYLDRLGQMSRQNQITIAIGEAYLSYQSGNLDKALQIVNSQIEIENNPFLAEIYFLQGLLYRNGGDNEQAQHAFEEAATHDPPRWLTARIMKFTQE